MSLMDFLKNNQNAPVEATQPKEADPAAVHECVKDPGRDVEGTVEHNDQDPHGTPTKINDAMLKMAEEIWPDGLAVSLDEELGKEGVIHPAPWRGMMAPEEREMIRGMTLAEMERWQLKLVPREMPIEATKEPDYSAVCKMMADEVDAGPQPGWEQYAHPSRSPLMPSVVHTEGSELAGGIHSPQDPNGTPQHAPGAKLDAGKQMASLLLDFSRALSAVAQVSTMGALKYSRGGWQHVPDGITRYSDAEWRHRLQGQVEELDSESGLPHRYHELWNCLAVLELELREAELRQQKENLKSIFR